MRIVFMGTPDFAQKSLEAIYNAGHEILAIVTNPDKPKGRGMKMIASPVKEFALEKDLKIYQPIKIRNNMEFIEEIANLNPDVLCVVAYGKILPKEILDVPKYGAINVHGSLLPKYRGAAPIQWAVINGEKETGITTMFMDEGMDTGDMILKEKVSIGEYETTGELWEELANVGADLLVKTLEKIEEVRSGDEVVSLERKIEKTENIEEIKKLKIDLKDKIKLEINVEKQGDDYSMAPMLNKEMAKIDWNKSALEIKNLVRGLNPIMGAYSFLNGKKLKFWKVEVLNGSIGFEKNIDKAENGEILLADKKDGLFIKTADGIISVLEVQAENSKRMDIKSFLNGNSIEDGKFE